MPTSRRHHVSRRREGAGQKGRIARRSPEPDPPHGGRPRAIAPGDQDPAVSKQRGCVHPPRRSHVARTAKRTRAGIEEFGAGEDAAYIRHVTVASIGARKCPLSSSGDENLAIRQQGRCVL